MPREVAACIADLAAAACRSYAGLAQELQQRGFKHTVSLRTAGGGFEQRG